MKGFYKYLIVTILLLCVACSSDVPTLPAKYTPVAERPTIYPDYYDVVVPCNIAPLTYKAGFGYAFKHYMIDNIMNLGFKEENFIYQSNKVTPDFS